MEYKFNNLVLCYYYAKIILPIQKYIKIKNNKVFSKSVNYIILKLTELVNGGYVMNDRFFSLPQEKQLAIINAGYRVFSQNTYKKSPMSDIAAEAGISKSLLFHYFKNKKELYLFLLQTAADTTLQYLNEYHCYEQAEFFETLTRGIKAKIHMMKKYPELTAFTLKCYYEKDADVCTDVQKIIEKYSSFNDNATLYNLNPEQFIPGLDIKMMYYDMLWASEGYIWEKLQQNDIDVNEIENDFMKMIEFWKSIYLRKEGSNERN